MRNGVRDRVQNKEVWEKGCRKRGAEYDAEYRGVGNGVQAMGCG